MTLLAPWALWFLGALGAVVAFYLLRIKRREAAVPALDFWLDLAGRTKVHTLWTRLKRLLSMLLWLAIVACLVLALGNPMISAGRIKPRAIAVVIDNSASMQTLEGGSNTRLKDAIKAVTELTSRRPVSDEWLIVEAGRRAQVLQPWTLDADSARRAADKIEPFGGAGSLEAAVQLASQLVAGKPDPCIVVVSDGAAGKIAQIAQSDARVVYWPVGSKDDNLGVTRLAVRPDLRRGNYQVLLGVTNASSQRIESKLTLSIDGSPQSIEPFAVEPKGTWEKTIVIDAPAAVQSRGGVLKATIERPDALAADNEAVSVLEPTRPAVVWLVTPSENAYFFEQALTAMGPLISPEQSLTMTPEKYEQAAAAVLAAASRTGASGATDAGNATSAPKPADLVVFNGCTPKALPPSGRFVFIGTWPKEVGATVTGTLETPQVFLDPRPHPLTEHLSLQGARLISAKQVTATAPVRVLAATDDGKPLIFLSEQGDRQSLCLGFDVLESDLPLRNAFPLLLRNTVAYMHTQSQPWLRAWYAIGETIAPARPLPPATASVTLDVLRGGAKPESKTMEVRDGRFAYTDTLTGRAVRLTVGEEESFAAVSLLDPDETRIGPVPSPTSAAETLGLSRRLFAVVPWAGLTGLVTLLVALEWLTYHKRWTE